MALSRQDWSWILVVPLIALIATAGAFIIYLPIYFIAIVVAYAGTKYFPKTFSPVPRYLYVIRVLALSLAIFSTLFVMQNSISGQYFKLKWEINSAQTLSEMSAIGRKQTLRQVLG